MIGGLGWNKVPTFSLLPLSGALTFARFYKTFYAVISNLMMSVICVHILLKYASVLLTGDKIFVRQCFVLYGKICLIKATELSNACSHYLTDSCMYP